MSELSAHPRTCRATIFIGAGKPLQLRELEVPNPAVREALVRIECCTLCGSDLHTITGARTEALPSILGHEAVGVVAAVGDPPPRDLQGQPLQRGDRVTWSTAISCGACDRCQRGLPQKCRELAKYGHEVAAGREALSGGLAEFILLRAGSSVIKLDPRLPVESICPVNCATATVAAALRTAGPLAGQRVLILGAGMLGLTAAAVAKSHAPAHIAVCDLNLDRLELARQFAADAVIQWAPDFEELSKRLAAACSSAEFDVVLELSGSAAAVEAACRLAAVQSRVILVGTVMKSRMVCLDPERIVRDWLSIHGVHNYAPEDLRTAVAFLSNSAGDFPFPKLVARTYPLERVNEAIEMAIRSRPVRIAIRP